GTGSPPPTHSTTSSLTVNAPASTGITNGGFDSSLSGWTSSGSTSLTSSGHTGNAAQAGSSSPTNGDSSLSQTFTVPSGATTLSFWYLVTCPDTITYDLATASLKDTGTSTTTTPLA